MTFRTTIDSDSHNRKATEEELRSVPAIGSREDYLDALADPQYRTSALYRELLSASIGKSNPAVIHSRTRMVDPEPEPQASAAMIEARVDTVKQLFKDPRYKSSAAYRWEVQQKVTEMTANDKKEVPNNAAQAGGGTTRVSVSTLPDQAANVRTMALSRIQLPPRNPVGDALSVSK